MRDLVCKCRLAREFGLYREIAFPGPGFLVEFLLMRLSLSRVLIYMSSPSTNTPFYPFLVD